MDYSRDIVFKAKQPQDITIQVLLAQAGEHRIAASAGVMEPGTMAGKATRYLKVSAAETLIQRTPFSL